MIFLITVTSSATNLVVDFRPHWLAPNGEYVLHGTYPCSNQIFNWFGVLQDDVVISTGVLLNSNLAVFRVEVPMDIGPSWKKSFYTTIPGKKVFISKIPCGFPELNKISIIVDSIEIGYTGALKVKPGEILIFSVIVNTPDFKVVLKDTLNNANN